MMSARRWAETEVVRDAELASPYHAGSGKKEYHCQYCRYTTDRKNNLKRHVITMHENSPKILECCGIFFTNKASLRDHVIQCHKHGYDCRICGRNFCRKALLKRHVTVHSGQKDFTCALCGYATSHKSNLDRHKKRHLPRATSSENLDSLLQRISQHPGTSPFQNMAGYCRGCAFCVPQVPESHHFPNPESIFPMPKANEYLMDHQQTKSMQEITSPYMDLYPDSSFKYPPYFWTGKPIDHSVGVRKEKDKKHTDSESLFPTQRITGGPMNAQKTTQISPNPEGHRDTREYISTHNTSDDFSSDSDDIETDMIAESALGSTSENNIPECSTLEPQEQRPTECILSDEIPSRSRLVPMLHRCWSCNLVFRNQITLERHQVLLHPPDVLKTPQRPLTIIFRIKHLMN